MVTDLLTHDSGKYQGHRYISGGRRDIKSKLYFCVLNMIRFNIQFQNKLNDFVKRGKNKKLALIAHARKQIIIINAIVMKELKKLNIETKLGNK
jgi:transposase